MTMTASDDLRQLLEDVAALGDLDRGSVVDHVANWNLPNRALAALEAGLASAGAPIMDPPLAEELGERPRMQAWSHPELPLWRRSEWAEQALAGESS